MSVLCIHNGAIGTIWPGDVLFHWMGSNTYTFPLHAGIYIGNARQADSASVLRAVGIPSGTDQRGVGQADWRAGTYRAAVIGQRMDQGEHRLKLKEVARMAEEYALIDSSRLSGQCSYGDKLKVQMDGSGAYRFLRGSCSQFVAFLYHEAGLPLVRLKYEQGEGKPSIPNYNENKQGRIYPSYLIRLFFCDSYPGDTNPFGEPWRDELASYPECVNLPCHCQS